MTVISAALVRNEANRWLEQFMAQTRFLSDRIVVLDDCSDDDTAQVCRQYADQVVVGEEPLFVTAENRLRQRLWDEATRGARKNDWILLFDADEILTETDQDALKSLLTTRSLPGYDALGFTLIDMWSETHFRDDQYWQAHLHQMVRAVRFDPSAPQQFPDTSHHCGSYPSGHASAVGTTGLTIRHMGWSRPEDREAKFARYLQADPEGKHGWLEQYHSILDPHPHLLPA